MAQTIEIEDPVEVPEEDTDEIEEQVTTETRNSLGADRRSISEKSM